ncbi:MAG: glycoside hydrolase family 9 protein [Myxococcales bacterium]
MITERHPLLLLAAAFLCACGSDASSNPSDSAGQGGATGVGGADAAGGTKVSTGTKATGGTKASTGTNATTGTKATGGTTATGGAKSTGGTKATGGTKPSGGTTSGSSVVPNEKAGDPHYRVDQFGYLPTEEKVAVIGCATDGFNAPEDFAPGGTLELRTYPEGKTVFSGAPEAWNGGKSDALAGDKGWWFDFSSVTEPGEYFLYDTEKQLRSHVFRIAEDVYAGVLVQAMRTYFYQREGFAKEEPYADARWTDAASHAKDRTARSVFEQDNAATERDVSGGWMDAGDQNKYVTFLDGVIPNLLYAYTKYPAAFSDDTNIPESGNGVPDVLDEVDWEISWLLKMQDSDGGVFIKAGCVNTDDPSPPSSDTRSRYYGKKCTSSSISLAAIAAQTALVYRDVPKLADKVTKLTSAAEQAWSWFNQQPSLDDACDLGEVKSGDADLTVAIQQASAVRAAYWLWKLTNDASYHDYFKQNYANLEALKLNWWGPYRIQETDVAALYTAEPEADPAVVKAIEDSATSQESNCGDYYGFSNNKALYRAFMSDSAFHWGSNAARVNVGAILYRMIDFGFKPESHDLYRKRALQHLHWLHGVNALGKVYLSNMGGFGAEDSVTEFFHTWFADGTDWDSSLTSPKGPAPGYLVGGPNTSYGTESWYDAATKTISPPYGQPGEKSYKDFNKGWPDASYAVTENSITYQAPYVRLLAAVLAQGK